VKVNGVGGELSRYGRGEECTENFGLEDQREIANRKT
jgi:hypothetical protein